DRVQDGVREGKGGARADRAELELVAGEGKRRGPVAVAAVLRQRGQNRRAQLEEGSRRVRIALAGGDRLEHLLQLGAEEDRDDRRRRLVGSKAMVLADARDRGAQQ